MSRAWGNLACAAHVDYLREVCREARTTKGAILECGSGLTSVLMRIFTDGGPSTLRAYDDFEWYEESTAPGPFTWVVCDGRPEPHRAAALDSFLSWRRIWLKAASSGSMTQNDQAKPTTNLRGCRNGSFVLACRRHVLGRRLYSRACCKERELCDESVDQSNDARGAPRTSAL